MTFYSEAVIFIMSIMRRNSIFMKVLLKGILLTGICCGMAYIQNETVSRLWRCDIRFGVELFASRDVKAQIFKSVVLSISSVGKFL